MLHQEDGLVILSQYHSSTEC